MDLFKKKKKRKKRGFIQAKVLNCCEFTYLDYDILKSHQTELSEPQPLRLYAAIPAAE